MSWQAHLRGRIGALELDLELDGDAGPLAIVGPNGSGKTTCLRMLAGAVRPEAGRITIGARVLFDAERGVDLPSERRRIGYVPQGYGLFGHLDVLHNVGFGLAMAGQARATWAPVARRALEDLDIGELAAARPATLSGGEQQRVALARALVMQPDLLLLDEPLAALDVTARRRVRTLLAARLRDLGTPSVVVTHDVRDIEALDAPVCVLERGRVARRGTLADLRADPRSAYVAELVGS